MLQVSVSGLYIDRKTGESVVVLKEDQGERILPMWIQSNEMLAIAIESSNGDFQPPRPLSHDLIGNVLTTLDARVARTIISDLKDHIYRAHLVVEFQGGILDIDSRPSDAVILALKFDAPILVEESVIDQRLDLARVEGGDDEDLWDRLQEINPEDLSAGAL
jgi:bifunctional DNase/RNase